MAQFLQPAGVSVGETIETPFTTPLLALQTGLSLLHTGSDGRQVLVMLADSATSVGASFASVKSIAKPRKAERPLESVTCNTTVWLAELQTKITNAGGFAGLLPAPTAAVAKELGEALAAMLAAAKPVWALPPLPTDRTLTKVRLTNGYLTFAPASND